MNLHPDAGTPRRSAGRSARPAAVRSRPLAVAPNRAPAPSPAIALRGVTAGYGPTAVVHDLDLMITQGELVGLVGPSGSGKTTILRLLMGRADVHGGSIELFGRTPGQGTPARVGYVPQLGGVDLDFPLTVEQVVLLGDAAASGRRPWFSRQERTAAQAMLSRLGLDGLGRRRLHELSGGQLQRTFLARALLRRCELLLLDEPTSGVDLATRREVLSTVHELHDEGLTVVLTTHDLNLVATHLPRAVALNGTVTADGRPAEVLTPAVLEATYGAPMRVIRDGHRVVIVDDEVPPLRATGRNRTVVEASRA